MKSEENERKKGKKKGILKRKFRKARNGKKKGKRGNGGKGKGLKEK